MLRFASPGHSLTSVGLLLGAVTIAAACGGGGGSGSDSEDGPLPFGLTSEVVAPASNADALAFAPDGRLFFAEHWTGAIRVVSPDHQLLPEPFATVSDIAVGVGWGLTGLALDPDFMTNHYVYALYTELIAAGPPPVGKPILVRFTDSGNKGTSPLVLVSDFPETDPEHPFSANGSVGFGPDGFLYLTIGDYDRPLDEDPQGEGPPQDLSTPVGKVLRIKQDGSAVPDNPFVGEPGADPRVFAYGFRAAFNFAFHPQTGQMYASDSTGVTCEEINIIEKGFNYGWPDAGEWPYNDCEAAKKTPAIHLLAREGMNASDFKSTVGVSGMEFISSAAYPSLGDSLVVCESGTQLLRRLVLTSPNLDQVTGNDVISRDCWLDIAIGPDGLIYYSNQTEIRRLMPSLPTGSQR